MIADIVPARRLPLANGRMLGFRIYGDPNGARVLFLHGTPSAGTQFAVAHEAAMRLNLALVAPDRWGYGLTDAPSAPSLPAFASDMAALMDSLGSTCFAVGGISGGAPYAAAVAACYPLRVTALALVSPVGPIADAGVAPSLPLLHRLRFAVLPRRPRTVSAVMRAFRWGAANTPRLAGRLMTWSSPRTDKRLIRQTHVAGPILGSACLGLRAGTQGPNIDLAIFSKPWKVDLAAIAAPSRVWIGTADSIVPLVGARALAKRIANCVLTELPGAGHLWVSVHHAEVLIWLAAAIGTPADARRAV